MGLLDLIKPKSALEKAAKQVREPYAQPEYRRAAMEKLLELGTEEAYAALLMRFTYNANGQIADESEKRDLVDELVKIGKPVLPSLQKFIRTEKAVALPIEALRRMLSAAEAKAFLLDTLKAYEPLDHRSTQQKTSLVFALAELGGAEVAEALVPYLDDHHDDVQFQTIGALERLKHEPTAPALAKVCLGDSHAGRVQRAAAQALANLAWPAKEHFDAWNAELKGEYLIGKKGQVVKKGAAAEG